MKDRAKVEMVSNSDNVSPDTRGAVRSARRACVRQINALPGAQSGRTIRGLREEAIVLVRCLMRKRERKRRSPIGLGKD